MEDEKPTERSTCTINTDIDSLFEGVLDKVLDMGCHDDINSFMRVIDSWYVDSNIAFYLALDVGNIMQHLRLFISHIVRNHWISLWQCKNVEESHEQCIFSWM